MAASPQIDPQTGERIQSGGQIDPNTGERLSAPPPDPTAYNPGPGKPGGYAEHLRPVGNIGRTALHDFTSIPGNLKAAATAAPEKPSMGDVLGNLIAGPAYEPAKSLIQSTRQSYKEGGLEKAATDTGGHLLAAGMTEGMPRAINSIPRAGRAGETLERVNTAMANEPVKLSGAVKPLQRATEIGERGGTLPTPVNKFLQRSQSPIDMTFPEARDYQSNLSSLTRGDEGMKGPMLGGVKQLNKGLFGDIKSAADTKGLGEDYAGGMKEYRQAQQLKAAGKNVGKAALWELAAAELTSFIGI